jgi:hypothetical protein
VFIAVLKVNLTVVFVETPVAPVAGTVEMMVGWACACQEKASAPASEITTTRGFFRELRFTFMTRIQFLRANFVTRK